MPERMLGQEVGRQHHGRETKRVGAARWFEQQVAGRGEIDSEGKRPFSLAMHETDDSVGESSADIGPQADDHPPREPTPRTKP